MKYDKVEILQPGKVCTIDKDNIFKQNENGVILVEIVEVCKKKTFLGKHSYKVRGAGDDFAKLPEPIEVPGEVLSPVGTVVIRYPADLPTINNNDIHALECALKYIVRPGSDFVDNSDPNRSIYRRLVALLTKLNYYTGVNEV